MVSESHLMRLFSPPRLLAAQQHICCRLFSWMEQRIKIKIKVWKKKSPRFLLPYCKQRADEERRFELVWWMNPWEGRESKFRTETIKTTLLLCVAFPCVSMGNRGEEKKKKKPRCVRKLQEAEPRLRLVHSEDESCRADPFDSTLNRPAATPSLLHNHLQPLVWATTWDVPTLRGFNQPSANQRLAQGVKLDLHLKPRRQLIKNICLVWVQN